MRLNRRNMLVGSLTAAFVAPTAAHGLDAAQFGVSPGAPEDQTTHLQRAINQAARTRAPLWLSPGLYRTGNLRLPQGAQVTGVRGSTRIALTHGPTLFSAEHTDTISLSGLILLGAGGISSERNGLVHLVDLRGLRITDCEIIDAGGNGISLESCDGAVTGTTIVNAADNAVFCLDSRGLLITANVIRGSGNGGIRVWQSDKRRDGSLIADNIIEDTHARGGGNGQNGNAINVFKAADVIVRGNHIRNAAFSAIRGNAASGIQIVANSCSACDDVALYSEFAFENTIIADNLIDGAGSGVSVTNFKEGGRLATVRGNILRNLQARIKGAPPEMYGIGIGVEADTVVSGNIIEGAQTIGIRGGWGSYLRDVVITGNILRQCGIGVGLSVVGGAGSVLVSDNLIAGAQRGAIFGMEWNKVVTGDLAAAGAQRYPQLMISDNQIS